LSGSTLYVGGSFTTMGGQTRNRIAAVDASSGVVASWNPNADNDVWGIAVSGSTVYVGGYFSQIGGQTRYRLAAINAATGAATSWNPSTDPGSLIVQTIAVSGSTIYVGGAFANMGGQVRSNLAALDATTGAATSWNPGPNSSVIGLAVGSSTVYVGGYFTSIAGTVRNHVAEIRTSNGAATSWNPNADRSVLSIQIVGSTIYLGGEFNNVGGQARNRAAAIDGTGNATSLESQRLEHGLRGDRGRQQRVHRRHLRQHRWRVAEQHRRHRHQNRGWRRTGTPGRTTPSRPSPWVGARSTRAGSSSTSAVRRVLTSPPEPRLRERDDVEPGVNGEVRALALSGNNVYAGGAFTEVAACRGTARGHRRRDWKRDDLESRRERNRAVVRARGLAVRGGSFTSLAGAARNFLGSFNPAGVLTTWNPNANAAVLALSVDGSVVHAGGRFTAMAGVARSGLAAINLAGSVTSWNPNPNGLVNSLVTSGATLYAGGEFTMISFLDRNYITSLIPPPRCPRTGFPETEHRRIGAGSGGGRREDLRGRNVREARGHWQPGFGAVWAEPDLSTMYPLSGGNAGTITMTLTGHNLQIGSAVKLIMDAEADIPGTAVSVTDDETVLTADFDLTGRDARPVASGSHDARWAIRDDRRSLHGGDGGGAAAHGVGARPAGDPRRLSDHASTW
jgi:hypothetical protein